QTSDGVGLQPMGRTQEPLVGTRGHRHHLAGDIQPDLLHRRQPAISIKLEPRNGFAVSVRYVNKSPAGHIPLLAKLNAQNTASSTLAIKWSRRTPCSSTCAGCSLGLDSPLGRRLTACRRPPTFRWFAA